MLLVGADQHQRLGNGAYFAAQVQTQPQIVLFEERLLLVEATDLGQQRSLDDDTGGRDRSLERQQRVENRALGRRAAPAFLR